jgi:trk system potassium uptake protein TrkH
MRIITGYLGRILVLMGILLCVPAVYSLLTGEVHCSVPFLLTALGALLVGSVLVFRQSSRSPDAAQAMVICTLSWIVLSVVAAVPLVLIIDASWIDGIFETMSGFTTTGITMFTGLDEMPRTVILWRSITQWIGGLGILTFFMAVASQIPGAHRLMTAESHKIASGRPVPGLLHTVKILWTIYIAITVAIVLSLYMAGMGMFDCVNHAFTTISTGGYSPHDQSIGWYSATGTGNSVLIEYILIAGMTAGGMSFLVHYRVFRGQVKALHDGSEVRLWWMLIGAFVLLIMLEQLLSGSISAGNLERTFRKDLFQVTSIISTTGYATEDLSSPYFGAVARQLFMLMMVVGGCVGSTSGGVKVLRVSILLHVAREEVRKLFRADRAVSGTRFEGRLLERDEIGRVTGIVFMWLCLLMAGGVITALLTPGIGGYQAFSGMFSALGNVGPCLISQQQMMSLHWGVKITYIIGMLAGRLEILPVLLIFNRKPWR